MRLAMAAVGVAVWVYGQRVDNANIRAVGIAMLALSVLMRFIPRPKPPVTPGE
jgi:hypothetical protein